MVLPSNEIAWNSSQLEEFWKKRKRTQIGDEYGNAI